jgi:hypothetical protein
VRETKQKEESMKRHIGKIARTDQRCVVVYMRIPGRETHALITPVDALPPRLEQAVMDVLESNEGQAEQDLANVLGRRMLPDTGQRIIEVLHERNYLTAVPTSDVIMLPRPNMPFPLDDIIRNMSPNKPTVVVDSAPVEKYNPHVVNQQAETVETKSGIARNLLIEAELLESEAQRKREHAYSFDASLRPEVKESRVKKAATPVVSMVSATADGPKLRGRSKKTA